MAPRRTKKPQPVTVQHYCDDCEHGEFINEHWNLDLANRKPICLKCPYEKQLIIRGRKACEHYKKRIGG